jgi:glycosyltransferase involved in cell wall biosynthesis
MKIAQIVSTPPMAWATGGCARVVYDLSRELFTFGNEVTILTTDLHTPKKRYPLNENSEFIEGIQIIRFRCISNFLAWKIKFYFSPGLLFFFRYNIKNYDIIHLQDLISIHAVMVSWYCKKTDTPYVLTIHGSLPWLNKNKILNKIYKKIFSKNILNNSSGIIVLNNSEYMQCKEFGISEEKIHTIPNGIHLHDYSNLPLKNEFKNRIHVKEDEKIILYLGRLHESKGIELLVRAFGLVHSSIPNSRLVLIGPDDGHQKKLENLIDEIKIRNQVLFFGYANDREKLAAYIDANVLVIPKFTGFPVTFLEACICGLPIITTNKEDELDWINKNVGYVTEYSDVALKDALLILLCDEKKHECFSLNGIQYIQKQMGWSVIGKNIELQYKKILNRG